MSQHEQMEELVAAWALSADQADDGAFIRSHIHACPSCQELANRFDLTANAIPLAVDDVAPPERLRGRILAAAALPRPTAAPDRMSSRRRSAETYRRRFELLVFERIPAYAAAAALVLALVIGGVTGEIAGHRHAAPIPSQVARFTLTGDPSAALHGTNSPSKFPLATSSPDAPASPWHARAPTSPAWISCTSSARRRPGQGHASR